MEVGECNIIAVSGKGLVGSCFVGVVIHLDVGCAIGNIITIEGNHHEQVLLAAVGERCGEVNLDVAVETIIINEIIAEAEISCNLCGIGVVEIAVCLFVVIIGKCSTVDFLHPYIYSLWISRKGRLIVILEADALYLLALHCGKLLLGVYDLRTAVFHVELYGCNHPPAA